MADTSHLERMGRELKCPICLSLLNSAVSLSCNHVFCNCCIEKSMKSASNCPVCKVPFRRREIHPAPHMDNLVSIYRSMEVASGVNIFVTQTAPSNRISDYETHPDDIICEIQENSKTCTGTAAQGNQRCKRKGPRRSVQANRTSSSLNPVKPSFPAKKRVHVPQCPPSETPTRSTKLANEAAEITKDKPDSSFTIIDKPVYMEKSELQLTPFFWLRDEEDAEKTTQETDRDRDQVMETPPNAPCFSDIKDSDDDEVPNEMTQNGKTSIAYSEADFFDSEMFEWTQRACSPEIHSSPLRMQADDRTEGGEEEKNGSTTTVATSIMESQVQNMEAMTMETDKEDLSLPCLSSSLPKDNTVGKRTKMIGKRTKKAVENRQSKRAKTTTNNKSRVHIKSEKMPGQSMQEKKLENNGGELNLRKKTSKRIKMVSFDANVTETAGNISILSTGENSKIQGDIKIVVDLPASSDCKTHRNGSNLKNIGKDGKKIISQLKKHAFSSKAKNREAATDSLTLSQCEVLISHSPEAPSSDEKKVLNMESVLRKCGGKHGRKKKNSKMVRFSEGNKSGNTLADKSHNQNDQKIDVNDTENLGADQDKTISKNADNLSGLEAIHLLSGTSPNKIQCAFCHSAEDSEASGVMVHYLRGKAITGGEIRGPNVIHSHKHCTEWAPNVYFKDDTVINLEAELARSRKIKCGLCEIRGAALGCFHKSCRRSFHVPCAKMTSKFRWDYDNFVLLCPLHANCKLPCEAPGSQSSQKRRPTHKGDFPTQQPQAVKVDVKKHLQWKSNKKAKNLFICCSGLTDVEKGIVSQFEKLSGVTVLKDRDPSVTHVVAYTDENGTCKRTLKFLMGVLEGKWIVNIEWVKACIKSMEFVDEQLYEIKVDSHGIRDGPYRGRLRILEKKSKLFSGYKFYLVGEFVPSYKGYLHDLVIAAGGTLLNRRPISENQEIYSSQCSTSTTFIVYSLEQPDKCGASKRNSILNRRRLEAEALATSARAIAVSNLWILNSIAGCKLQNFTD